MLIKLQCNIEDIQVGFDSFESVVNVFVCFLLLVCVYMSMFVLCLPASLCNARIYVCFGLIFHLITPH